MLYVFQVDTGTMLTFDMRLALESVSNLREAIWQTCRIPIDRQVLLVSGGECLDPQSGVCFYAAGTDTNPIFLFNKSNIESPSNSGGGPSTGGGHPIQLFPEPNTIPDVETIRDQIEACLNLPSTYSTVVSRVQLAQRLLELAREITKKCDGLIHDQHLQHQGWAAVVANLEDIVTSLKLRFESFENLHSQYIESREEMNELLETFDDSLSTLDNIRIPESLHSNSLTLLEWIKSTDSSNQIQTLTTTTSALLQNLTNPTLLSQITKDTQQTVDKANQASMKEIKGLEERLFGLDQLLNEAKSLVQEQNELALAFEQNQGRARDLKDNSILPDLCQSHQHQLIVMSRNHGQLEDIRRRCLKAKEELGQNLNSRLKWVVYVQKLITDVANRIHVYSESLRRLKCYVEIIKQINSAGDLYCETIKEVLRRGEFVKFYEEFTARIVEEMEEIYKAEVDHRKQFAVKFENHFLSSLFHGLDDYPPSFATQRPKAFDALLPELSQEDLFKLKDQYPDLTVAPLVLPTQYTKIATSIQTDDNQVQEQTIEELQSALETMTKLNIDIESNRSSQIEALNDRITDLEATLKQYKEQIDEEKKARENEKLELENTYQNKIESIEKQKEEAVKSLKDSFKNEFDGLRSRYRLMQSASIEVKTCSSSCEERLDLLAGGGGSPVLETPNDGAELIRLIDNYIQKAQPSPGMLRRLLQRYEPALGRHRNISCSSFTTAMTDLSESDSGINRSIYNIDTQAVEPSTTTPVCYEDTSYREMIDSVALNETVQRRVARLLEMEKISVQSCKFGDSVLVYWNEKLSTYIVYLNTKNIHFLHTECLKILSEMEGSQHTSIHEFIGSVVEKEFCVARRAQNRYRVPQGFHFYRVRVNITEILSS